MIPRLVVACLALGAGTGPVAEPLPGPPDEPPKPAVVEAGRRVDDVAEAVEGREDDPPPLAAMEAGAPDPVAEDDQP